MFSQASWEVPVFYGDELLYFKRLTYEDAIAYFYDFAREQDVKFDDDTA